MRFLRKFIALSISLVAVACLAAPRAAIAQEGGRVVLVLPFENRSGNASLNWIGNSFPDTLNKRLNSAGFLTISRDDRYFAFDHLGLPEDFKPSRATTIRIAQQLEANFVIVGSFNVEPIPGAAASTPPSASAQRIIIQAQVLSVDDLRLSSAVQQDAVLDHLFDAENTIAWKAAHLLDPRFNIAVQTFLAAPGAVPLPAFEDYIRGANAATAVERVQRLKAAVTIAPTYAAALLALGKEQYTARDYAAAAATFAKVPATDRLALEANFYLGLARFNSANYAGAEQAFRFVAARLPLPEVVNDEAVALSRQNKDAVGLFQRASEADPANEDYHYNLALALFRRGDTVSAAQQADIALKLKAADNDVIELRNRLAIVPAGTRLEAGPGSAFTPLERIIRTYSEAGFRQAAFQLDQVRAARMDTLPPTERAAQYNQLGQDSLSQGLLPEAEGQFQSAIAADPHSAAAHAGLAQVREQSGQPAQARQEAQTSLSLHPNAAAWVVLARLDLADNQLTLCAGDVIHALQLDPSSPAALSLRQALQMRGQVIP